MFGVRQKKCLTLYIHVGTTAYTKLHPEEPSERNKKLAASFAADIDGGGVDKKRKAGDGIEYILKLLLLLLIFF